MDKLLKNINGQSRHHGATDIIPLLKTPCLSRQRGAYVIKPRNEGSSFGVVIIPDGETRPPAAACGQQPIDL